MAQVVYTEDEHRRAFEAWYRTGRYDEACKIFGDKAANMRKTIHHWSLKTYHCRWDCPWHGWKEIKAERDSKFGTAVTALEAKKQELAASTLATELVVSREQAVEKLYRSDLERLAHWEYLYGVVLHSITPIALPSASLIDPETGKPLTPEQLENAYKTKVRANNLESAIRTLKLIQDAINELKKSSGVEEDDKDDDSDKELTLEEARALRAKALNTPTDKRTVISQILQSEDRTLKAAQSTPVIPSSNGTGPAD